jgi:ubiquitin-protein ligase
MLMSKFNVTLPKENDTSELKVIFQGPEGSPYQNVSIKGYVKYMIIYVVNLIQG